MITARMQQIWQQLRQQLREATPRERVAVTLLLAVSLCLGMVTAYADIKGGLLFVAALAVVPVICGIVAYPRFGIMLLMVLSFLLFFLGRLGISFPLGTILDGIQALLLIGLLFRIKRDRDWSRFRTPVATVILIWIGYNLIAVANPSAASRLAWVYTVRSVAMVMLMYFVFVYQVRRVQFIRQLFVLWLLLAAFGALYAIKQEYFGFSAGENAWIASDPRITELFYIDQHWRKFSIFSDPMLFSYNMAMGTILCIGLLSGPIGLWKRVICLLLVGLFMVTMLYSGTRSAYVLVPAALGLFTILRFNRVVLFCMAVITLFSVTIITMPTTDPLLVRFQTAFKPSDDPSFNVRTTNQKIIQPFIRSHPIGGGLGATGGWGKRFAPDSYLANFPPDSGYVRVAVELGWIGLLLFCTLIFMILKTGINHYYLIKDPELKSYCLAVTLMIFSLHIGNYPQEALVQYPSNILFFLGAALIEVTYRLDRELQGNPDKQPTRYA